MRNKISNIPSLKTRRQELRGSSTPQEIMLWSRLKKNRLGCKFRRQHSFGNYIADFYCPKRRLVIEIDGSQHMEQKSYDDERTAFFERMGLRVVRFWNNEINTNINGVMMQVMESCTPPSPSPLKRGGGTQS